MCSDVKNRFPFLDSLNEQQRAAVECTEGPSLIVAGAGSGKTTVLTTKIAYLVEQGVAPWNILALTFTNKAAREMRDRIEGMVGLVKARSLWMGTFHSIFSRILRQEALVFGFNNNYTIYQPSDTKSLLKAILKERGLDDKVYKLSLLAGRISEAKNMLVTPKKYKENAGALERDKADNVPLLVDIYQEYFTRCHQANAMDFDDLLLYTFILLEAYPDVRAHYADKFRYVLVDEYQDTNYAQFAILKLIAGEHKNICVVGDDAQSIYGFRGARIDNILTFDTVYSGTNVFKLEQNYRSTQNIVNAANSLIHKNVNQIHKNIFSANEVGSPILLNEVTSDIEEGEMVCNRIKELHRQGVAYSEMAVLYRTNGQSRILEETMRKRNIPCVLFGSNSFYDHKEIKDVLAYLRMIVNPSDEEALRRIINYPARGIGNTTIDKVFACAKDQNVAPWNVVQQPDLYDLNVNKGTKTKLYAFAEMIKHFVEDANSMDAYQIGQEVLRESGLMALVQSDLSSEGKEILDNYSSLLSGMSQFVESQHEQGEGFSDSLMDYLSEVALLTDSDKEVVDGEAVRLMTVHIAKGLEFDVVFVTGMEEGLFPSAQCYSPRELEEERRLFFVAITRAKKRCYLSNAKTRFRFGKSDYYEPSQFLQDIDSKYIYQESSSRASRPGVLDEYIDFDSSYPRRNSFSHGRGEYRNRETSVQKPAIPRRNLVSLNSASPVAQPASVARMSESRAKGAALSVGNRVEHATFGIGVVERVEDSVSGMKAVINFNNCGEKTLLLKFAKLKVIG